MKVDSVTVWLPSVNENRTMSPICALTKRGLNLYSPNEPTETSWMRGGVMGLSILQRFGCVSVVTSAVKSISSDELEVGHSRNERAIRAETSVDLPPLRTGDPSVRHIVESLWCSPLENLCGWSGTLSFTDVTMDATEVLESDCHQRATRTKGADRARSRRAQGRVYMLFAWTRGKAEAWIRNPFGF